jgi:hypothetical protein
VVVALEVTQLLMALLALLQEMVQPELPQP